MAITKADLIVAFNEAASKEFAFIPPEDKIEYQFSERFLKKMDRLINRQSLTHHAFKKIIIVAAVIAVLAVASLSVYAAISDTTILDGLVEIYNKYIVVRFDKIDDKADDYKMLGTGLAQELKENGIYPVLLPEALLNEETHITEIEYKIADGIITVNIHFRFKKEKGYLTIDYYEPPGFIGESEYPNAKNVTVVETSGIQVYVFEQNRKGSIVYKDGTSQYGIFSSMTYEQAIEFAKTIKWFSWCDYLVCNLRLY